MKILLLEDNKTLNETIKLKLERNGYKVYTFLDGKDALQNIHKGYSCFILDINVPSIDGIKILEKIREYYYQVPIIIISSTVELDIIKKSYKFGCNDYLKKPFFIDELEIKVEKFCKAHKKNIIFDKNNLFNFHQSILTIENKTIKLTQKESMLLNLFLTNKNKLVTYENIENYVWESEYVSLESIRTLVKRLKQKLLKPYIKASSSRGYFFND